MWDWELLKNGSGKHRYEVIAQAGNEEYQYTHAVSYGGMEDEFCLHNHAMYEMVYCIGGDAVYLAEGEKYGYQLIAELAARSDDTFCLKEGTLYPILHTLEQDRRVVSYEREAENGRIRRYYRITPRGKELLTEKAAEWRFFASKVDAIIPGRAIREGAV